MRRPTVKSIVESLIHEIDHEDPMRKKLLVASTVDATCNKIENMSFLLKAPLSILFFAFNLHAILRKCKFFHLQTIQDKVSQVNSWRKSPIRTLREFVVFHEKLTFFVYFSKESE